MAVSGARQKTIAFVTLGSLGDLHPCLALGVELKRRGHAIKIITTEFYRSRVERLGMGFCPMRPDWDPTAPELIGQCEELKTGPEILFRRLILPHLRDSYADLLAAVDGADLMVAGELAFAAPLVAEKLGLRWASLILSPCSFFSTRDPSVLVNVPWMMAVRKAGHVPYRALLNFARWGTQHWWNPVRELREQEHLTEECDPLVRDKFSPYRVLALFSSWLATPQRDWPSQTVQPGFVFYDGQTMAPQLSETIRRFLESGNAPIVFTLGSTAVSHPGSFYATSIEVARRLSARAILIGATREMEWITSSILSLPYVPYSEVFAAAAVIVHQGGSGTTAQALRAGRPMLCVPWGWDQPDNGLRAERRGGALCIPKHRYSTDRAADALDRLQNDRSIARSAKAASTHLRGEPGLAGAVASLEALIQGEVSRRSDSLGGSSEWLQG